MTLSPPHPQGRRLSLSREARRRCIALLVRLLTVLWPPLVASSLWRCLPLPTTCMCCVPDTGLCPFVPGAHARPQGALSGEAMWM